MRGRLLLGCAAVALLCLSLSSPVAADTNQTVRIAKISIPGVPLTSFDISWTDPTTSKYFLADRSNKSVDIVDMRSNEVIGQVGGFIGFTGNNDTSGPDGVVTTSHDELWAGDGDSTVKVIDLRGPSIVAVISTGGKKRADEMIQDGVDNLVAVANNADDPPFLSIISVGTRSVTHKILFPDATDGIEQPAFDPATDLFYLAVPATEAHPGGEIAVIDPHTGTVMNRFVLPACVPHGLVLGPGHNMLAGCNGSVHTVVFDDTTGAITGDFPQTGGGADEVWYNPSNGTYYTAANVLQRLGVIDANRPVFVQNVQAGVNSHSVAADSVSNHIFVPISAPDPSCPRGCIAVYAPVPGSVTSP
ncbi:MAG: cytochrome C nitrite reductase [Chloroflexi bacterium]|nr:cytochrome C nitrite reductase [Chloroflexota bacterium]